MVAEAPGSEIQSGQIVATAMGGMGRAFDGGCAEYTCVPVAQVESLDTDLPWTTLGGLPETMQTAWGSLFRSLCLEPGEHLLARGATTSVGLAAAALARNHGATVTGTTRSSGNEALLRESGVDQVIIDTGSTADEAMRVRRGGFDKVLEMIGPVTLRDSLCCTREGGLVGMTGSVAAQWSLTEFMPIEVIPTAVRLTTTPERMVSCGCRFSILWNRSQRERCASPLARYLVWTRSSRPTGVWNTTEAEGKLLSSPE